MVGGEVGEGKHCYVLVAVGGVLVGVGLCRVGGDGVKGHVGVCNGVVGVVWCLHVYIHKTYSITGHHANHANHHHHANDPYQ